MGDVPKWLSWLVLLIGVVSLMKDYGVAGFDWYRASGITAILVLVGVYLVTKDIE